MNNRIQQLKSFLAEEPDDCFLNYALALEYLKLEELDEANYLFSKLIKTEPGYLPTYFQFGKLLEKKRAFEEAANVYANGMALAKSANANHTFKELEEALIMLTGGEDDPL